MEKIQLKTQPREIAHRDSKHLERQGLMPGELYGHNVPNMHLSLNQIEFEKVLRKAGESTIIELALPDGGTRSVLIQDVQRHYLHGQPIHVDFYEVSMTEKLTATVPLEFVGEPDAVKILGGTLVKVLSEVEVECLPSDLPHTLEVDISSLKTFEDIIEIRDIKVSDKVEIKADPEDAVVMVQKPRDMEAEIAAEVVNEADAVAAVVGQDPSAEGEVAEGDKPAEEKK